MSVQAANVPVGYFNFLFLHFSCSVVLLSLQKSLAGVAYRQWSFSFFSKEEQRVMFWYLCLAVLKKSQNWF